MLGRLDGQLRIIERCRIELVDPDDARWAKQPYHAADRLEPAQARELVERGFAAAHRVAVRELRAIVARSVQSGHDVAGCAVLVPEPMPDWSIDQILAVHIRMHKAEGALFPDALARAAGECGLPVLAIREKHLSDQAERALATRASRLADSLVALGRSIGPPWGKDQKAAALAAMVGLKLCGNGHSGRRLSGPK